MWRNKLNSEPIWLLWADSVQWHLCAFITSELTKVLTSWGRQDVNNVSYIYNNCSSPTSLTKLVLFSNRIDRIRLVIIVYSFPDLLAHSHWLNGSVWLHTIISLPPWLYAVQKKFTRHIFMVYAKMTHWMLCETK